MWGREVADKLGDEFREANEMHGSSVTDGLITCPKHGDFPRVQLIRSSRTWLSNVQKPNGRPCFRQTERKTRNPRFRGRTHGKSSLRGVGRMDIRITKGCLTIYVEIDGPHHFRDVSHHKSRVKDVQTKDLEKHLKARAKGQRVIRIDQDWVWRAYTKKSKDYAWLARLQGTIQKISNGDDPGIDEMFLSGDREKYLEHPCYQKEAVKEIISTSDITIR